MNATAAYLSFISWEIKCNGLLTSMDYSKWDKMEDGEEEATAPRQKPQVTRLEQPSSITFGGNFTGIKVRADRASNVNARPTVLKTLVQNAVGR
jgi:hypothetical protein